MNTTSPPPPSESSASGNGGDLMDVLLASRRRWKNLTQLVADLIFETDADGRFTFVEAGSELEWADQDLIGKDSSHLLPLADAIPGPNPFLTRTVIRGRKYWIKRANDSFACFLIYASALETPAGQHAGVRGLGIDISDEVTSNTNMAITRQHSEIVRHISATIRSRTLPRHGIPPAFEELGKMLGASGGVLLTQKDENQPGSEAFDGLFHRLGDTSTRFGAEIEARLRSDAETSHIFAPQLLRIGERDVIICRSRIRYNAPAAMALWRDEVGIWSQDDANLADAALATFASALEIGELSSALARNARFDPLTGTLNRAGLIAEIDRRIPRLDREKLPGTLLVIGLDRFSDINTKFGVEAGDSALQQVAVYLRDAIRPTDLVGRLGGDIFGLWLDGADHFASAERAETFCQNGIAVFLSESVSLTFSVGLAARGWETGETAESLIDRASLAMRSVKLAGGARWHNSLEESSP